MRTCHILKTYLRVTVKLSANFFNGLVAQDVYRVLFCLHQTTEHTQNLRHVRVGQPGPPYVLIATISSSKMDKIHQVRSYMRQKPDT